MEFQDLTVIVIKSTYNSSIFILNLKVHQPLSKEKFLGRKNFDQKVGKVNKRTKNEQKNY